MSAQTLRSAASAEPQATAMSMPPTDAIQLERLVKSFDARPILRGLSYALPAGRTLVIFGPNGAGKTTLLRTLATLARPTSGRALIAGLDVIADAHEVRRVVGYVGHQPHPYEELTARENLLFFARMYGLRDGAERATALLERVGLRARANDRVRTFSRGQAQRLALARGVIHDPAVLLLDEPDTGLDQEALALLERLVSERRERGLATVLTTHNLERGLRLADDALTLVRGRIAYAGAASALDVAAVERLYAGESLAGQATERTRGGAA
ncbi:MAG TPA: heme ABC exporter ATP-binding protein CcmA [Ktedonobacterales bacterium]|nr:heme ABC exporter ATP-binding protein CcmA [Ktedonobacterales bacterium]